MSVKARHVRKGPNGQEELVTHLLDFVELPCSHSGKNMAEALVKILKEWGIEDKVSN